MANLNFNAQTVDPQTSFDPLPAGWYNMQITESEMKPTANGEGQYLQLKLQVLDGQYANRVVFDRLNLVNKNPTAQEIAYRTLSAICHATGVIQVDDSNQLHGIPMEVKVSVRAATEKYEASNDVKGYRAAGNGMGAASPQPQGQTMAPPQQPPMQQPAAAPQGGWQQPQAAPQQQQQPAWQPPTPAAQPQQAAPAPQGQPAPAQHQQPAWANTPDANPHPAPTQGQAPSAEATAGVPPWGQAPQQ